MNGVIKARLILESRKEIVPLLGEVLGIHPSTFRTEFPPTSIAPPYWKTEIIQESESVSDVFRLLQNRIAPKLEAIQEVCRHYQIVPLVMIVLVADFEHRPFVDFTPEQISFLEKLGAELILDLESVFPDPVDVSEDE